MTLSFVRGNFHRKPTVEDRHPHAFVSPHTISCASRSLGLGVNEHEHHFGTITPINCDITITPILWEYNQNCKTMIYYDYYKLLWLYYIIIYMYTHIIACTSIYYLFHLQLHPPAPSTKKPQKASTKARNSVKDEESKCKSSRDTSGA